MGALYLLEQLRTNSLGAGSCNKVRKLTGYTKHAGLTRANSPLLPVFQQVRLQQRTLRTIAALNNQYLGIDMTLYWVAKHNGFDCAKRAADMIEYSWRGITTSTGIEKDHQFVINEKSTVQQ